MGEVYRCKLLSLEWSLTSTVSTRQVGWQTVINCIDERLWNHSREILKCTFLSFSFKLTYLLKQRIALDRSQTADRVLWGCFSVSILSFSLSVVSLALLFPWKLASRWRGWRGSGRQTRTSGPVWPCMVSDWSCGRTGKPVLLTDWTDPTPVRAFHVLPFKNIPKRTMNKASASNLWCVKILLPISYLWSIVVVTWLDK